jgi:fructokinase
MYLVCGEALFDVFTDGEQGDNVPMLARPGGSPFNVAIGMTRLGHRAGLYTGLSTDVLGRRLHSQLKREDVCLDYIVDKPNRTTVVLVALDDAGVAKYSFYGDHCADRELTLAELPALEDKVTGLHFGSYTLVAEPTASTFLALAQRERGQRLISLDPNVRPTVEPDMQVWRERLRQWRGLADVIKVSEEDLELLYPGENIDQVAGQWLQSPTQVLVVTRGAEGAVGYNAQGRVEIPGVKVNVADTVGAGDSFQATLLSQLPDRAALTAAASSSERLQQILARSAQAAAITCSRAGANPPYAHELP